MRASLTNFPFLRKISNGNVWNLGGNGGKYNNFRKSNALGRCLPLESQARYYSRCREEANFALGRPEYERGGGIDEQEEAQIKYETRGGKRGMKSVRRSKQQWSAVREDYNRGIESIKGRTKEWYGEREDKAKWLVAGTKGARSASTRGSTIFVDNLPDSIHCQWLGRMFQQCGYVLEVQIPSKKRWKSNTKFGFVRFRSSAEAEEAMENFNGVWCMDRRISVQKAYYDSKPKEDTRKRNIEDVFKKKHGPSPTSNLGEERAEAKKGEVLAEIQQSSRMKRVEATEIDESWMKFCLVGVLKDPKGGELL
ncbi:Multiple RNA-binding domain-containing protein 1 [Sarracenia purpurea var. burkii]